MNCFLLISFISMKNMYTRVWCAIMAFFLLLNSILQPVIAFGDIFADIDQPETEQTALLVPTQTTDPVQIVANVFA